MTTCNRPGCSGAVDEFGFCDLRGHHQEVVPARTVTVALPPTEATTTVTSATVTEDARGDDDAAPDILDALSQVDHSPDHTDQLFTGDAVPEPHRICGNCGRLVGQGTDGQDGLTEGYCTTCTAPFSFVPKLRKGDMVADRFQVVGPIGHGGLSWAYLATDTHLGQLVVLKGLIRANDVRAAESVENERKALVALNHRDIVRIFDFVIEPDPRTGDLLGYIVMEYSAGWTLRKLKHKAQAGERELPILDVVSYGLHILRAFEHLHDRNFLYCDLKPDNVIHEGRQLRLIDMGAVRAIDDHKSPTWGTKGYQVPDDEIRTRGLTVRSDIYTIGRTLLTLFGASPAKNPKWPAPVGIEVGVDSLQRVLDRACEDDWHHRFESAAQMREQLTGVLRQIRGLGGRRPNARPSTVFEDLSDPLDGGLGVPPGLDRWTTRPAGDALLRPEICCDGQPPPTTVASRLPPPRLDLEDPAGAFLTGVSTADPRRLLDELAAFGQPSVEIELWRCRALLALADYSRTERILANLDGRDWRTAWHRGLLALARSADNDDELSVAKQMFDRVRAWLPGELTPLVALGCVEEYAGRPAAAEACYQCVWRTDSTAVVAAFGLARIYLANGDRDRAVGVLDDVPARSQHYDRARIAAIRTRAGHFDKAGAPAPHDLGDVVARLAPDNFVGVDGERIRARLVTFVLQTVLDRIVTEPGQVDQLPAGPLFGESVTERGIRLLLWNRFLELAARQAESETQHDILTDLANAVRPWTWW